MPTLYTRRTKPSSPPSYSRRPATSISYLVQETLWKLLLEDWSWAILLEGSKSPAVWTRRP